MNKTTSNQSNTIYIFLIHLKKHLHIYPKVNIHHQAALKRKYKIKCITASYYLGVSKLTIL
jgi:hypothetical protein